MAFVIPDRNIMVEFPDASAEGAMLLVNLSEVQMVRRAPVKEGEAGLAQIQLKGSGELWWIDEPYDLVVRKIKKAIREEGV